MHFYAPGWRKASKELAPAAGGGAKTSPLPINWIAVRLQTGTPEGAKPVLHHWLHANEKTATAVAPCAQVQLQSAVRPLSGACALLPPPLPPCYSYGVMQVTVKMPDQVARQWGETPDAVGRHVMEDAAIEGYRAGRLSHRQAGEMLGFDYWQTEAFLKEHGVPLNYSAADLEADNATLDKILAGS